MGRKQTTLGDEIRRAVDASGLSRAEICRRTGIHEAAMSRFMAGTVGLTLANVELLAQVLDLHIVTGKRNKKGGAR